MSLNICCSHFPAPWTFRTNTIYPPATKNNSPSYKTAPYFAQMSDIREESSRRSSSHSLTSSLEDVVCYTYTMTVFRRCRKQGASVKDPRSFRGGSRHLPCNISLTFDPFGFHTRQRNYDETSCSCARLAREATSNATSPRSCVLSRVSQEEAQVLAHVSMFELRVAGA